MAHLCHVSSQELYQRAFQRPVILTLLLPLAPIGTAMQVNDEVRAQAQREKQPLLDTLKALVEIESGSGDVDGVTRIGTLITERLRALCGRVDLMPPAADRPRITGLPQQFADTVVASFRGRGSARILVLAHMDTVNERGMLAQQPFRVEGDHAYGLGIADDEHGIAVILDWCQRVATLAFTELEEIEVRGEPSHESMGRGATSGAARLVMDQPYREIDMAERSPS